MEAIQLYWVNMFLDYGYAIIGNDIIHCRTSKMSFGLGKGYDKISVYPRKPTWIACTYDQVSGIYDYLFGGCQNLGSQ